MNCERMETRLIAYLDGRAPESERLEVEQHLASCAACRARAEDFRALWGVLDQAPMLEPSAAFDARLSQRIAAEPRVGFWESLLPSPRVAFAISLLLAVSVWMSSVPPAPVADQAALTRSEEEFKMIKDLPVLEDYDVLVGFEPLSAVPAAREKGNRKL